MNVPEQPQLTDDWLSLPDDIWRSESLCDDGSTQQAHGPAENGGSILAEQYRELMRLTLMKEYHGVG